MMLANGQAAALPRADLTASELAAAMARSVASGARIITCFDTKHGAEALRIGVLGWDDSSRVEVITARAEHNAIDSVPRAAPEAAHVFAPLGAAAMHEVAVGPVHAGVIEPGHFRFQCFGETVLNLEILLGYQHRGVTKALARARAGARLAMVQDIAGDTTIGHTLAYCQLIEALSDTRPSARAHVVRAIALELERLANHVGDTGAIAGDIGYQPTAALCGRLRGAFLNVTAAICGNRFGRWLLTPGGVQHDIPNATAQQLFERLIEITTQYVSAADRFLDTPGVLHRLENTGIVSTETALQLGLVGVAARACGLARDVRQNYPAGFYMLHQIPVAVAADGDVYARTLVRRIEAARASDFVQEALQQLPDGELTRATGALRGGVIAVSLVEGWRGEIAHIGITDGAGDLAHYEVVDPSSHNWPAVAAAMSGQQISDFPLCNKSFNLSYAGHDL